MCTNSKYLQWIKNENKMRTVTTLRDFINSSVSFTVYIFKLLSWGWEIRSKLWFLR